MDRTIFVCRDVPWGEQLIPNSPGDCAHGRNSLRAETVGLAVICDQIKFHTVRPVQVLKFEIDGHAQHTRIRMSAGPAVLAHDMRSDYSGAATRCAVIQASPLCAPDTRHSTATSSCGSSSQGIQQGSFRHWVSMRLLPSGASCRQIVSPTPGTVSQFAL